MTVSDVYVCSPQRISQDVKIAMTRTRLSDVSARKGELLMSIEAGIHEAVLFLQTGHGQAKATRDYVHIRDAAVFMHVFRAFKL